MKYLERRSFEDRCPFCKNYFTYQKKINEYVKFLDRNISFYEFKCAGVDHVVSDYVSLYLTPTMYRRITCILHPDAIQLHLNFTKQISEVSIEINGQVKNVPVKFDYLLEDCDDINKLMERLEIYQAFS